MLRFGKIDQIGDSSKDEEKGRYRVRLDDDNIVTGWLFQLKQSVVKNQQDWVFDEQEPVAIFLCDDNRTGVILGAYNTSKSPQKETDKDIEQKFFSDESYMKYDRKNHLYEIYVKGSSNKINIIADDGEVNVTCKNATIKASDMTTVDGKLTVKDDAKFEKKVEVTGAVTMDDKLDVTGDIIGQAKVKSATGVESQADVTAGAGLIHLLTHKHPTAALGPPSTPIP